MRQHLSAHVLAGGAVAVTGVLVLAGWLFDLTFAKSVLAGWRVMVPPTAVSFVLVGVALILAARAGTGAALTAARLSAFAGLLLPLITFAEYAGEFRVGIEGWFGIAFDPASEVAGRMSPLTALSFSALAASVLAATLPSARAHVVARIGSGATLLTAWLAMLAVAFDTGRLADVPRFPGMAVLTIALMALASWGAMELSFERDDVGTSPGRSVRLGALVLAAFAVPLFLGWIRVAAETRWSPQLVASILAFLLAVAMAAIVWRYAARLTALTRERERAFADLEQRVAERTREIASRNEALRYSEDRLREADRRKDEFLATLAHELRNPLAPIRSAVAVLRSPVAADHERLEAGLIMERQVAHMARLIDDLLDVSRITAGKLPLRKAPVFLTDVLDQAVATVRPHLDAARHRFSQSLPREPIVIEADEARMAQVFANLLHNACKYTEPGGEITLAVSQPTDHEVNIAVRDNGIGIPSEFLPRLFEKFSQVAPALDRSQGGLGLGLSLVQGIVAMHDGRVEARSGGSGRGSEFSVRLPVSTRRPAQAAAPAVMPALVPRRVIVVDDNADSADSLALLLRLDGHNVETANDGEEALEVAERFQPDAMLLDLGMPHLNGFEVCKRVRERPWGRSILMIAQTGWGQAQDRARTVEAGFDAHLTKPIDPAAVQEMLQTLRVS